jgi:exodeoxyribonuclease VIII
MNAGILSMPAEQYRAAEGISKSDLDWIAPPRTPAHYKAKRDGLIVREETPAMRLGTLTHRAILEPESLSGAFVTVPTNLDLRTVKGKEWKQSVSDTPIITEAEATAIQGMLKSVWANPKAARLLKGARTEVCLFAEDSNGTLLKGRLDALPSAGNAIVDLKTAASADPQEFERSLGKYAYHKQGAFYLKLCRLLGLPMEHFVFIVVEKVPPYAVAIYSLDDEAIRLGNLEIARDLAAVRECEASGKWPSFGDEITNISLPAWMLKSLEGVL